MGWSTYPNLTVAHVFLVFFVTGWVLPGSASPLLWRIHREQAFLLGIQWSIESIMRPIHMTIWRIPSEYVWTKPFSSICLAVVCKFFSIWSIYLMQYITSFQHSLLLLGDSRIDWFCIFELSHKTSVMNLGMKTWILVSCFEHQSLASSNCSRQVVQKDRQPGRAGNQEAVKSLNDTALFNILF